MSNLNHISRISLGARKFRAAPHREQQKPTGSANETAEKVFNNYF